MDILWETGWEGGKGRAAKWWCFPQPLPQLGVGLTMANLGHSKCSCQILSKLPMCLYSHRREAGAWLLGESALLKINFEICEMNHTLEVPICLYWLCRKPVQLTRFRHLTFRHLKIPLSLTFFITGLTKQAVGEAPWKFPTRIGPNQTPLSSVHGNLQSLTSESSPLELLRA